MRIDLRPSQIKAVDDLDSGSILAGGVGSGKSRTALAYFFLKVCYGKFRINGEGETEAMRWPRDLYIITTATKRNKHEWDEEAALFSLAKDPADSFSGCKMVIDSWNNIKKYEDVKDAFFIFDEQHLLGYGVWVQAFRRIAKKNKWILLSATPGDNWINFLPVFIGNGFYEHKTDFVEQHVVYAPYTHFPKIQRYTGVDKLRRLRDQILVTMPDDRKTVRHHHVVNCEYDRELFDTVMKKRWNPWEDEPIRESGMYFHLMRKVVNQDMSRLAEVCKLAKDHQKLIIFYNFDYELEILRTLGDILDCPVGEMNGHKRKNDPIPDGERWVYLVQYLSGAEAWNCVETDTMVFWSLNYSWSLMEQAEGRIDRLNTPFIDLHYYLLKSKSPIDTQVMKALVAKEKFNEDHFRSN